MKYVITIDQRTSSTKALLFDERFTLVDRTIIPHRILHPKDDWAEADAEEIYRNAVTAIGRLQIPADAEDLSLSIVNQRETFVIWDKVTGKPVYHAILWQDRRGAAFCQEMKDSGMETAVRERTGLVPDTFFSASGMKWVLDSIESVRRRAENGDLLAGTMDSWLIWNLTAGRVHATDYTNASRTMLFNINDLEWDPEMLRYFTIPASMMPEARPGDSVFGETDAGGVLPCKVKIAGVAGNSHGAMVGQMCFEPGMGKTTYGTGSSVMFNVGEQPVSAPNGMVCSVGFSMFDRTYYVVEGHVHSSGAVLDWLTDNLRLVDSKTDLEQLPLSVPDNGGVYFVPAFQGLGSPWWVPEAKAMITGLTMNATRAHVVRAALESLAYQVADLVELVSRDMNNLPQVLCIDGESANNDFLMQFQADILGFPVRRLGLEEASGLGSAILNFCARGILENVEQVREVRKVSELCLPQMKPDERIACRQGWLQSVHTLMLGTRRNAN
ncbi:MAG: glycerol kinase GlpK [Bacteroidaceae bacterium]|nr:glycerol kinase GlpK [Bacteroidaceae bacterium]